jgi:hypothetical protein
MKAQILHDEHGQILAVSKIGDLPGSGSGFARAGMMAGPGQQLVEVELSAADDALPVRDLHAEYRVDPTSSRLVQK